MHWLAMAHGAATQSMPIVTAYDTLGEEGLTSSLEATRAKLMFLDAHLLKTLIKPLQKANYLEIIVYDKDEDLVKEDLDALLEAHPHLKVISFEELRKAGADNPTDPVPPSPEEICCIMYTSGSTGAPKGVTIKHKAIVGSSKNPFLTYCNCLTAPSCWWYNCDARYVWPRGRVSSPYFLLLRIPNVQ
jgi:long-chain acyl-CoA synthetase